MTEFRKESVEDLIVDWEELLAGARERMWTALDSKNMERFSAEAAEVTTLATCIKDIQSGLINNLTCGGS